MLDGVLIDNATDFTTKTGFDYFEITHCVKSVQIRCFFWSVFSCIQSEYRKIRTRKTSYMDTFHVVTVVELLSHQRRSGKYNS